MVLELLLKSLYFFLPAYIANMSPVLFRWLPWGAQPISERWLGKNKTWRGFIIGTLAGTLTFFLQQLFYPALRTISIIDYPDFSVWLGFLLSLGVMSGDAIKSFYKRKQRIPPGKPWIPWDQLDFVIGGIIGMSFIYVPPAEVVAYLLIASPIIHIAINFIGYRLGMKKNKL